MLGAFAFLFSVRIDWDYFTTVFNLYRIYVATHPLFIANLAVKDLGEFDTA